MATISFDSVQLCKAAIEHCVDRVMKEDIAQALKTQVAEFAKSRVYDAYPNPRFNSRWYASGGILDESLMTTTYQDHTLTLEQDVPWQNLGTMHYIDGRGVYDEDLVKAIQTKQIYNAHPRPYLNEAKDDYVARKADSDMQKGLDSFGFGNF